MRELGKSLGTRAFFHLSQGTDLASTQSTFEYHGRARPPQRHALPSHDMDNLSQVTIQVPPSHYSAGYDSKRRFISYWYQIQEIINHAHGPVLEIGVGNGMVSSYLRKHSIALTTIDHDPELKPDIVGDAKKLPFKNNEFDLVAGYEILEHLQYEDALSALREMHRVAMHTVVISLPDSARTYSIESRLPLLGVVRTSLRFTFFPKEKSKIAQHHWELGLRDFPLARVRNDITKIGFHVEKEYSVFENPRHYFFILHKI
jgi:hypothetical protein